VQRAIVHHLRRVRSDDRAESLGHGNDIFAVFCGETGVFSGLVTKQSAARFPQRIFADLVPVERQLRIRGECTVEHAVQVFDTTGVEVIAVVDDEGDFLGAVTRASVLSALLEEERRLHDRLRNDEAHWKALFGALPDRVLVLDATGRLQGRSGVPLGLSEWPHGEQTRSSVEELWPAAATQVRAAIENSLRRAELETVAVRGGAQEWELRIMPLRPSAVLCVARDITETVRLRAQVMFTDRLAAMGILAAGVAHEINNPLTYLIANLESMAETMARQEHLPAALSSTSDLLKEAADGAHRIRSIVADLRTFSRSDQEGTHPVDVLRVLDSAINIVTPHLRHRTNLFRLFEPVDAVEATEARLGQVFINLLVNAADAIPDGAANDGRIEVRLHQQGREVHVVVADSGIGMPPEAREHLFKAFFTTKAPERGTGLGLYISNNIVVGFGGQLLLEEGIDGGCAFRVILPACSSRAAPSPETPKAPHLSELRILVVDDEPAILHCMGALLRPHTVAIARDGPDALETLSRDPFDVVICDLMMPGMSGVDLYREVCNRWPVLARRFVFMTGGTYAKTREDQPDTSEVPVLLKPFDRRDLHATIARVARAVTAAPASRLQV
jgi:signal transduction histidine kinase/ActR/RegA family two-component response regulator